MDTQYGPFVVHFGNNLEEHAPDRDFATISEAIECAVAAMPDEEDFEEWDSVTADSYFFPYSITYGDREIINQSELTDIRYFRSRYEAAPKCSSCNEARYIYEQCLDCHLKEKLSDTPAPRCSMCRKNLIYREDLERKLCSNCYTKTKLDEVYEGKSPELAAELRASMISKGINPTTIPTSPEVEGRTKAILAAEGINYDSAIAAVKPKEKQNLGAAAAILIALVFASLISLYFLGNRPLSGEQLTIEAWTQSKSFISDYLKAPGSAQFPSFSDAIVEKIGSDRYSVVSYVDAKNSFGTSIRTKYHCILKRDTDGTWTLESMNTN